MQHLYGTYALFVQDFSSINFLLLDRYNGSAEEKSKLMRERDEARDQANAFHAERDAASRDKGTVSAHAWSLRVPTAREQASAFHAEWDAASHDKGTVSSFFLLSSQCPTLFVGLLSFISPEVDTLLLARCTCMDSTARELKGQGHNENVESRLPDLSLRAEGLGG